MGVFQKIRDNSLLTLILVGGSLFLFIMGDALTTGSFFANSSDQYVGSFEGSDITIQEYDKMFNEVSYINQGGQTSGEVSDREKQNFSQQTWNQLLMKKIMKNEGAALGIDVTKEEVEDMLYGNNPYAFYVYRLFGGPQNFSQVKAKIAQNPDEYYNFANVGSFQEAEMLKNFGVELRKQEKLVNLLQKTFYVTKSEAKNEYKLSNTSKNIEVAKVPYYLVPDSLISISESDKKSFYSKNKDQFKQANPTKKIHYAVFKLNPSQEDEQEVISWAGQTVSLFQEETNDKLFVRQESELPFDETYYKKGNGLEQRLDTVLFDKPVGYVYGPYLKYISGKKTYNVAKVIDSRFLSDSINASHIQITPDNFVQELMAKNPGGQPSREDINSTWKKFDALADSLYELVQNNPSKFSEIAKAISSDSVSGKKGGEIGWLQQDNKQYAKELIDSIFINSEKGETKKLRVSLDNGYYYYHIVKVNEFGAKSKKIQVGIVSRSVIPGNSTLDHYYTTANQLAIAVESGADLSDLKDSLGYYIDSANVQPQQFIVNDLAEARKVVYWAFQSSTDVNSPQVFDLQNNYIVAIVKSENDSKYKLLSDASVDREITRQLSKQKKFDYIANKLGEVNDESFSKVKTIFDGSVIEKHENVNGANGVQSFSYENSLTGAIAGLGDNEVSKAILGSDGLYFVRVISSNDVVIDENTSFDPEQQKLAAKGNNVDALLQELIYEKSDVEDNRRVIR